MNLIRPKTIDASGISDPPWSYGVPPVSSNRASRRGGAATFRPLWVHEIKHDGYRLMVRRDGERIRCFTRNGHDWADRFPAIVDAALRIKASSFLIDGEVVIARDDGTPDFHALRSKRRGHEAVLYIFDLIEHDGDELRRLPLIERKRRLARLIGKTKRQAIRFTVHLTGDGPTVFEHVCRLGLEGIVSKRTDAPYRSGKSKVWLIEEFGERDGAVGKFRHDVPGHARLQIDDPRL